MIYDREWYDPWASSTARYVTHSVTMRSPSREEIEWQKCNIAYEAIAESRHKALAPLAPKTVRLPRLTRRDPLLHHKLRCQSRRPRLSLLERVR